MIKKLLLILISSFAFISTNAQNLFEKQDYTLKHQWDINDTVADNKGLFKLKAYKPVYILFANYSTNVNKAPQSDSPDHSVNTPIGINDTELKFQLSFKTKVLRNIFGKKVGGGIWMGYTQTSRWQLYNEELSRPFRETNYEPEIMLIVPTIYSFWRIDGVYSGIGLNHQSNGRGLPLSRSWNRIILQVGWETKNLSIIIKPWWRIQEAPEVDDNPGIENYIGRGELLVAYKKGRHNLSFIGRHSLRFGDNNRGGMQINYSMRVYDNLKIYTQLFHGYGESMIDYNHSQTTIGIGVSLHSWK